MKTPPVARLLSSIASATALAFCLAGSGCGRNTGQPINSQITKGAGVADPLAWVLASHDGEGRLEGEIRDCRESVRAGTDQEIKLQRVGWRFVATARRRSDSG